MRCSRHLAVLRAGERARRPGDLGRIDPGAFGKRKQEILVAEHMLQHPGEKGARARGGADVLSVYSAHTKEAVQPFRLLGDEGKRLNRQHFRCFAPGAYGLLHPVPFAFP